MRTIVRATSTVVASFGVRSDEGDWEHYPRKFGKYHLLAPLAQGGMGALYLAVTGDRGLERMMVIKTVLPHLADAEYVARFRDEAKVVVKLSHGNLIPVFDAGLVGGELFLAMDFVEGRDLRAVWNRCAKKQVAFPIDVAVYIVKELCRGLAYAHSFPDLNLVHRDISPPNVLVSYTGEVKLTDFGLASSTLKLEKTAPGIIYGKVAYMSPEQARGEKLDGRSDMYATGIVLWELLTGRQLFPPGKDQPQDLLSRAKNPEPPRPSKRAPRVPAELDEICVKALAATKEDRYGNCDEMRMALQSWLAQNAPTTDGTRMAQFLQDLFAEDISRERVERQEMIAKVRTRALTLPPTDELRQMIEKSDKFTVGDVATADTGAAEGPVRKPGSVGRRASDRGDDDQDRRRESDRRLPVSRGGAAGIRGSDASAATALKRDVEEQAAELDIGSVVEGRYRIIELIGEGGMGKVYMAEHVEIGKRVALKVLHASYSRMPDLVERFRREARAASKIGHPNIVDVTDSGATADGSVYFVMEYLEGVELGSVIEREGALDVARALRISGQICRALSAAHREGIIHRDLKPENIFLITRGGEADIVKVLDFGIAKTTEAEAARERRLTSPGMAMGTPEYMAPEQAAGRAADARTDIYSLGAIMYEMCTGLPPYSGENFMEILTKKATQDPPVPITVRTDLPLQVSQLIASAMARDPVDRPQSMDGLEYELNKCLAGRGVAVAQILGMTTDAAVVASLNPGMSVRNLDDGIVWSASGANRAGSHAGMSEVWETRSGVSRSMPSGRLASEPSSRPSIEVAPLPRAATPVPVPGGGESLSVLAPPQQVIPAPSAPVDLKQRSAAATTAWVLFVLLLLGGGAVLAYSMLVDDGKQAPVTGTATPPAANAPAASAPAPTPPAAAAAQSANAAQPGSATVATVAPDGSATVAQPAIAAPTTAPPAPPVTDNSATVATVATAGSGAAKDPHKTKATAHEDNSLKGLLAQADAAEAARDWDEVRAVNLKLEKFPRYAAQAVYAQAWAAFQQNDSPTALTLSSRAAKLMGPHNNTKAILLYADTIFKQGDPRRAKDNYVQLRKSATDRDTRSLLAKKIAACNQALGLPDHDGILGD